MKTFWPITPKPGNVGDILTPWMMRQDGVEPEFVGSNFCGKILGIGSIMRLAQKDDQVWTTGIMRKSDRPDPMANFRAVRGPLTADACRLTGKVPLGDGALCLPRYYQPESVLATVKTLFVFHYVDWPHRNDWPKEWKDEGNRVMTTLTTDVKGFVDQITSAEHVVSSSLHGYLIALAYGIPARWIKLGDRLSGDGTKFVDGFQGWEQANIDDLMAARPWINQ